MILIIYFIYLVFVVAYFEASKNKSNDIFGCILISVCVPGFGFIMSLIHNSNRKNKIDNLDKKVDKKKVKNKTNQVFLNNIYNSFNSDLIFEEYDEAKKKMLMFNKFNLNDQSRLYIKALNCSNTEIVHFAAASLMKIKQNFEKKINFQSSASSEDFEKYVISLNNYVNTNLIEGTVKQKLIDEFLVNLENIKFHESNNKTFYQAIINLCLQHNSYDKATFFLEILLRKWKYDEESWLLALKAAYESRNKEWLREIIDELQKLDLCVSRKTQNTIDFWSDVYAKDI